MEPDRQTKLPDDWQGTWESARREAAQKGGRGVRPPQSMAASGHSSGPGTCDFCAKIGQKLLTY